MIPFWKKTGKHSKPQSAQKRRQNAKPAMPRTAQQSIPMQRMFEDGTCRVKPNYYTRTIQYQDINYQLAQQEDKTAIFEEWCSFLNFFDSSIKFELSFVNMATDSTEFEKSIRIPFQKDGFDDVRAEYSQMLRQQLAKGNNGLTKTKFITFGVEGESMAQVKPRLDHIQNDLLNNFHRLGVQAKPLNGAQRLKLMHDIPYETHPADRKRQCVFGGSSNTLDFLPLDRTGNRRFVPVMVYPERAEVHILEDEQASREYINQMWAEAMEIYRSGNFRLRFSPAMNAYLKAHQKDFMPEDTKAGQILDYLERYSGSIVCSKQLYKEALGHDYDEPKQWELREINDIMNNAVTGWRAFSNPRYFPEPYRRQKGWERIRNDNEPDNSMDGFQEIPTEEMEQLGLPEEWLKQK